MEKKCNEDIYSCQEKVFYSVFCDVKKIALKKVFIKKKKFR